MIHVHTLIVPDAKVPGLSITQDGLMINCMYCVANPTMAPTQKIRHRVKRRAFYVPPSISKPVQLASKKESGKLAFRQAKLHPVTSQLTVGYMKVNGLDEIAADFVERTLHQEELSCFALSETHFRADVPRSRYDIAGYRSWHTDRSGQDKGGGGLTLYYREDLRAHCHLPNVAPEHQYVSNERQWLLLEGGRRRVALLSTYMACVSSQNDYITWNTDLYTMMTMEARHLRTKGFAIIGFGDFNAKIGRVPGMDDNCPNLNANSPLFKDFTDSLDLIIMNTLPICKGLFTHFTERPGTPFSKSVIDFGLVDGDIASMVTSFVIDSDARIKCGTDHSLLKATFSFTYCPTVSTQHKDVLSFDMSDPNQKEKYCRDLDKRIQGMPFHQFQTSSSAEQLQHLTTSALASCRDHFQTKPKKSSKRRNQLPATVITAIKTRDKLREELNALTDPDTGDPQLAIILEQKYQQHKTKVTDLVHDIRLKRRTRLRARLLTGDATRRKFWDFVKHHYKSLQNINAAYDADGNVVFSPNAVHDAVHGCWAKVFGGQVTPPHQKVNPDDVTIPLDPDPAFIDGLPYIPEQRHEKHICRPFTPESLDEAISELKTGKSHGTDNIPAEAIRYSGKIYRKYLLEFYNQVLIK